MIFVVISGVSPCEKGYKKTAVILTAAARGNPSPGMVLFFSK